MTNERMDKGDMVKSRQLAARIIAGIYKATAEFNEAEQLHVWELVAQEYRQEFSRRRFMQPHPEPIRLHKPRRW